LLFLFISDKFLRLRGAIGAQQRTAFDFNEATELAREIVCSAKI
jgi:hypothetical protein